MDAHSIWLRCLWPDGQLRGEHGTNTCYSDLHLKVSLRLFFLHPPAEYLEFRPELDVKARN